MAKAKHSPPAARSQSTASRSRRQQRNRRPPVTQAKKQNGKGKAEARRRARIGKRRQSRRGKLGPPERATVYNTANRARLADSSRYMSGGCSTARRSSASSTKSTPWCRSPPWRLASAWGCTASSTGVRSNRIRRDSKPQPARARPTPRRLRHPQFLPPPRRHPSMNTSTTTK
jgi:hypothetical protein